MLLTAAGVVFLPIIKPKPWVRRDGLSLDFVRSIDFQTMCGRTGHVSFFLEGCFSY